jgi:hypothetical protein
LVPAWACGFDPELGRKVPRSHFRHFDHETILVNAMDDVEKYRQYAAECRRLAEKSSAKDKAVLLEIAEAWIACAERAKSRAQSGKAPSHK